MSPSQCGIRVWEVGVEREVGQTKACTGPLGEGVCGEDKGLVVLTMEISQQTAVMAVSVGEQGVWGHATVSVTSQSLQHTPTGSCPHHPPETVPIKATSVLPKPFLFHSHFI